MPSSFDRQVQAITHDCSTLGGNSGSAVIDLATGHVIGLHFAGAYLKANYAVASFDLAADKRVVDAGVNFANEVNPAPGLHDQIWIAAASERPNETKNNVAGKLIQSLVEPSEPGHYAILPPI